jgi:hypothetical protein
MTTRRALFILLMLGATIAEGACDPYDPLCEIYVTPERFFEGTECACDDGAFATSCSDCPQPTTLPPLEVLGTRYPCPDGSYVLEGESCPELPVLPPLEVLGTRYLCPDGTYILGLFRETGGRDRVASAA